MVDKAPLPPNNIYPHAANLGSSVDSVRWLQVAVLLCCGSADGCALPLCIAPTEPATDMVRNNYRAFSPTAKRNARGPFDWCLGRSWTDGNWCNTLWQLYFITLLLWHSSLFILNEYLSSTSYFLHEENISCHLFTCQSRAFYQRVFHRRASFNFTVHFTRNFESASTSETSCENAIDFNPKKLSTRTSRLSPGEAKQISRIYFKKFPLVIFYTAFYFRHFTILLFKYTTQTLQKSEWYTIWIGNYLRK